MDDRQERFMDEPEYETATLEGIEVQPTRSVMFEYEDVLLVIEGYDPSEVVYLIKTILSPSAQEITIRVDPPPLAL